MKTLKTSLIAVVLLVPLVSVAQDQPMSNESSSEEVVNEQPVAKGAFDIDASGWDEMDRLRAFEGGATVLYALIQMSKCGGNSALDKVSRPLALIESAISTSRIEMNPASDLEAGAAIVEMALGGLMFVESRRTWKTEGELLSPFCDAIVGAGLLAYGVGHGLDVNQVRNILRPVINVSDDMVNYFSE